MRVTAGRSNLEAVIDNWVHHHEVMEGGIERAAIFTALCREFYESILSRWDPEVWKVDFRVTDKCTAMRRQLCFLTSHGMDSVIVRRGNKRTLII